MLKASVILAHPYARSLNHAIYHAALSALKELRIPSYAHDLYEEEFDPLLTAEELGSDLSTDSLVNRYARELMDSEYLIFIHPNWWGQPPAVLKGYIDRVIRPPHAYDFQEIIVSCVGE